MVTTRPNTSRRRGQDLVLLTPHARRSSMTRPSCGGSSRRRGQQRIVSSSATEGLHDEAEAQREGERFFALLDGALLPLRDRIEPLRVALHWPSKPVGDQPGESF